VAFVFDASSRRRRNPEIWHALNRFMVFLICLAGLVFIAFWFYPEIRRSEGLNVQLKKKLDEKAAEELKNERYQREVRLLKNDPEYMEIIARDKLDMMKDGETIIRLDPSKEASPSPAPSASEK
jgi:cell division protein FtsB